MTNFRLTKNKYNENVPLAKVTLFLTEHQIDFILESIWENDCKKDHEGKTRFSTGLFKHVFPQLVVEQEKLKDVKELMNINHYLLSSSN